MKEVKLDKYAVYNKIKDKGKDFYQYLPTGKLSDVIYEKDMEAVSEADFFRDGKYFVKVVEDASVIGIGEAISVAEVIKRYDAGDPIFSHYDKEDIDFLKSYPADKLFYLCADMELSFQKYHNYFKPNYGETPIYNQPHGIVDGSLHWYLELHKKDKVSYEPTLYDDKKYRGQDCDYYTFVRVAEYEIEGQIKRVIVGRDEKKYDYAFVQQTELDEIIDKAKGLIAHDYKYAGFAGVSPIYVFSTEDCACVFHDKQEKIEGKVIATVTGSGDANLDLFLYGADKIISFDTNTLERFQSELKFVAAKYLPFEEFQDLFANMNKDIFNKIKNYLPADCQKFFGDLYAYCEVSKRDIRDAENGGLFYPTLSIFMANSTIYNEKGYYNEENYSKLQKILQTKTLEDIVYYNCDLFDLPELADLSEVSYIYLSNIMDFIVGVDKYRVNEEALKSFKDFILNKLLPVLKKGATIDLSYIKKSWHDGIFDELYYNVYQSEEGFSMKKLSNETDKVLTFDSTILEKIEARKL